ncbi:putative glycosyl transferase [Pseudomonas aeruginosa DK2]|nr:putative glycosyl transferase [Pseudomonas aeruginosa DK2]
MRIALLAPLPPEKNGIADYASHFRNALQGLGIEVATPLAGVAADSANIASRLDSVDWNGFDLVHAELGGGRLGEFIALRELRKRFPRLPLSATVHDPERMVWRRERLPWPLNLLERLPSPLPQAAVVLADPLTLREERAVAQGLTRLVTLTGLGGECLARRMRLPPGRVEVINHGNLEIATVPLPSLDTLRLLYFGFIYRGKGIEDLLEALADLFASAPEMRQRVRLTLAGGTAAEMAFGAGGNYLDQLKAQIAELGLADAIDWNLNLAAADIPRTIQAHHVMVLPYRESKKLGLLGQQRGTSGALSWAAACGRGAITSDARAFAEEVASGNGAIYPQGDVAALSEQLLNLAREPRLAQAWAERAGAIGHARTWPRTALRSLAARGHRITVLLHSKQPVSAEDRQALEPFLERLVVLPRRPLRSLSTLLAALFAPYPLLASVNGLSAELQRTATELLREPWDVVQVEHSYSFQPYERPLRDAGQPFVLTEHNVESSLGAATYDRLPGWALPFVRYDQWRYRRWERRVMSQAAAVVAVTEKDARQLGAMLGRPVPVVVNGVDCEHFAAARPTPEAQRVLFLGNYEYAPNVDAVEWMLDEILPRVWAHCPEARMSVCGYALPAEWAQRWSDPRIEWQGFVPDLLQLQSSSSVFLAALRHGGGSKLKVLEALAAGLPLASTAQGVSGLELRDGEDYLGGESAEQLANAVVRLLQDPAQARALGENGRAYARRAHDWSVAASQLEQVYAGLAEGAPACA